MQIVLDRKEGEESTLKSKQQNLQRKKKPSGNSRKGMYRKDNEIKKSLRRTQIKTREFDPGSG